VSVGAVDGGRRGVEQVPALRVAAALQDFEKTDQIGIDVGMRLVERMPHSRLAESA
jgi:hypothetical protein